MIKDNMSSKRNDECGSNRNMYGRAEENVVEIVGMEKMSEERMTERVYVSVQVGSQMN